MAKPRNPTLVRIYDAMLTEARNPLSKELYLSDGRPHRGASHRCAFWDGYLGIRSSLNIPGTLASACYAAGKTFSKEKPGIEYARLQPDYGPLVKNND